MCVLWLKKATNFTKRPTNLDQSTPTWTNQHDEESVSQPNDGPQTMMRSPFRNQTDSSCHAAPTSRRRGSRSLTATTEHGPWGGTNTGHPTMILTGMTHAHYQPALHPPLSDLGEYRAPVPTYHPPPPKSPPSGHHKPTRSARCTKKRCVSQSGSMVYTLKPLR